MSKPLAALALCAFAFASSARAEPAVYALSIGNNLPLDGAERLPELRYADDDALRYFALLERASAHAELLTVLDDATRARHHARGGAIHAPSVAALRSAVGRIAQRAAADLKAGREPVVLITYSGHGARCRAARATSR